MMSGKVSKDWSPRPLADCGHWVSGGTPRRSEPAYWGGDIPWISAKSLKVFDLNDSEDRVTKEGSENGTTVVPPGTVLFVVRGMSLANEFRVGVTSREVTFNQDLRGIVPASDVDARFLARYLRHAHHAVLSKVDNAAHGTKRLPTDRLRAIEVPLPPLQEQKRIAAILDQADAIRYGRSQAIKTTGELVHSVFISMFGHPASNPKGWPVMDMCDVVTETQYGTSSSLSVEKDRFPILRMNNITYTGDWDVTDLKWLDFSDDEVPKYTVNKGDLLFNRTNSPHLVGKSAVWPFEESYGFAGYLIRVRFDDERILPEFVSAYLNSDYGKTLLAHQAVPSNNMSNISATNFKRLRVILPPIDMQRVFVERLTQVRVALKRQQDAAAESEKLFCSVTQYAFRGEL